MLRTTPVKMYFMPEYSQDLTVNGMPRVTVRYFNYAPAELVSVPLSPEEGRRLLKAYAMHRRKEKKQKDMY